MSTFMFFAFDLDTADIKSRNWYLFSWEDTRCQVVFFSARPTCDNKARAVEEVSITENTEIISCHLERKR